MAVGENTSFTVFQATFHKGTVNVAWSHMQNWVLLIKKHYLKERKREESIISVVKTTANLVSLRLFARFKTLKTSLDFSGSFFYLGIGEIYVHFLFLFLFLGLRRVLKTPSTTTASIIVQHKNNMVIYYSSSYNCTAQKEIC